MDSFVVNMDSFVVNMDSFVVNMNSFKQYGHFISREPSLFVHAILHLSWYKCIVKCTIVTSIDESKY